MVVQAARRSRLTVFVRPVLAGVAVGCLTLLGQSVLGPGWHRLANSGAMWSLGAFAVGTRTASDRQAAVAGFATLILAVASYYAAAVLFVDAGAAPRSLAIWGVTACVAGPIFGLAGRWWRTQTSLRRRIAATSVLGAVFVAEGLWSVLRIPGDEPAATVEIVFGVLVPVAVARTGWERISALAWIAPISVLILGAEFAIDLLFR